MRTDHHVLGAGVQVQKTELIADSVILHSKPVGGKEFGEPAALLDVGRTGGLAVDATGKRGAEFAHRREVAQEGVGPLGGDGGTGRDCFGRHV